VSSLVPTAEFASLVFGDAGVALDDPAEGFHEASRLYPGIAPARLPAMVELTRNAALQQTVARASFTRGQLPGVDLPPPDLGDARLGDALAARRSLSPLRSHPLPLPVLATLLAASYRSAGGRRPTPSGGALYPLELYAVALDVAGLEPGVHHYDPYAHRLERLGAVQRDDVARVLVDAELALHAAALLAITGMFFRSRFKYGLRGYRFVLLEAGHVVQTATLAAAALGVPALPLGGYYDRLLDELVGADSLHEATVYALLLGGCA
jgi:SagB-type dehydrogenase family enzyme